MAFSSTKLPDVKPVMAYDNPNFIRSTKARTIRVICEFEEPINRLRDQNVKETIMFWGSARAKTRRQYDDALAKLQSELANDSMPAEQRKKLESNLERLKASEWMCELMDRTAELSRRITEWAMTYKSKDTVGGGFLATTRRSQRSLANLNALSGLSTNVWAEDTPESVITSPGKSQPAQQSLMVCTGGGPGLMEAANYGASLVPGAKSIGMGISLPFEAGLNPYVTTELAFGFHYFFTRKYWMCFGCRGLVVAPGGFGTMDEMFELLTLKSTGKIRYDLPVVLLGKDYWNKVVRFDSLVKFGLVEKKWLKSILVTDDVSEAFTFLTSRVQTLDEAPESHKPHKKKI